MSFEVRDLGRLAYGEATAIQRDLLERVARGEATSTLLLVEHDPVVTLGAGHDPRHLLLSPEGYRRRGIEVVRTDRGGDVTYHGPGQLVAYPIFDLTPRGRDLHRWLRDLEEGAIRTLEGLGIEGRRFAPNTGVWVGDAKIAAIGIKVRRWVSMHGLALNCNADLSGFETIVPCGLRAYPVTSIARELGRDFGVEDAKAPLVFAFQDLFGA